MNSINEYGLKWLKKSLLNHSEKECFHLNIIQTGPVGFFNFARAIISDETHNILLAIVMHSFNVFYSLQQITFVNPRFFSSERTSLCAKTVMIIPSSSRGLISDSS